MVCHKSLHRTVRSDSGVREVDRGALQIMRKAPMYVCFPVLVVLLAACGSSSNQNLIESYRAPGTLSFVFDRVAVIALNGGPEVRQIAEDTAVKQGRAGRLVAAHTVLSGEAMRSYENARQSLVEQGFDGALTLRVVRAEEINPGETRPGSFSSYAGSVPPGEAAFGEGRMRIEANVFRLADGALIWHGIAECKESRDPEVIVKEAAGIIAGEMRRTGLIHD